MTYIPTTRLALLTEMQRRLDLAATDGSQIIFVEPLELAYLVKPELDRLQNDSDGTANLMTLDFTDVTVRNKPVRIVGPESYMGMLDCNAETEQMETP